MLKNDRNILFEQLSPADITGPLFDGLQQLYSNYKDRIDRLPKHIVSLVMTFHYYQGLDFTTVNLY